MDSVGDVLRLVLLTTKYRSSMEYKREISGRIPRIIERLKSCDVKVIAKSLGGTQTIPVCGYIAI